MGPKAARIVNMAITHPEMTQGEIAARCNTSINVVKITLYQARVLGIISLRPIDVRRSRRNRLDWLPEERRSEYKYLVSVLGADEARRVIKADMIKNGVARDGKSA